MAKAFIVLVILAVLGLAQAQVSPVAQSVIDAMDQKIDPCNDFYDYACGGWIKANPLPADKPAIFKGFTVIGDHNNAILHKIVQTKQKDQFEKVSVMFDSCMDTATANRLRTAPLERYFSEIMRVRTFADFVRTAGMLQREGFGPWISAGAGIDAKDPSKNIAQFSQGGYTLPSRDLYLDTDNTTAQIRLEYVEHLVTMFKLLGSSSSVAALQASQVMRVETVLAKAALPDEDLIDPFATYNKLDIDGLKKISPHLEWDEYLAGMGYSHIKDINVVTPAFFANLSNTFPQTFSRMEWTSYLTWVVLHEAAPTLSADFVNATFSFFGTVLRGQKAPSPRWETCLSAVDGTVGELLGALFVKDAFTDQDKNTAHDMIMSIEDAMKDDLETINWMDPTTRTRALKKLSLISNQVGYPEHPDTYDNYHFKVDEYAANTFQANSLAFIEQMDSVGKKADRNAWEMTADTINAYYDPTKNQMVFPAGILQTPYFNGTHPLAMNYGGAGMIMGHELTHGFDNQGKDYNGEGKLENWWEPETEAKFNAKAQCIINQYSKFEVLPGVHINGKTTQGENIADCGGIKNSHYAYLKKAGKVANETSIVPFLTNEKLFFVAYAQGWCAVASPQYLRNQVQTDPHSWAKFRVLGPLINLEEFSALYKCPVGSFMNPANRCPVW